MNVGVNRIGEYGYQPQTGPGTKQGAIDPLHSPGDAHPKVRYREMPNPNPPKPQPLLQNDRYEQPPTHGTAHGAKQGLQPAGSQPQCHADAGSP